MADVPIGKENQKLYEILSTHAQAEIIFSSINNFIKKKTIAQI